MKFPLIMRFLTVVFLLFSGHFMAQFNPEIVMQWENSFQGHGATTQVKGMSVAIRSANALWTDQYGISAESEPLNEDHLFAMGSVSKTITAATILQMYEEGLLTLDDPINMYLDSYENVDPNVTIKQLLNHTSGIFSFTNHPDLAFQLLFNPSFIITPEEVVTDFVLEPEFAAGTDFSYSNTGYVLLGMIVAEIAGQTYYEEARERFDFDTNYPSFAIPPYEISADDLAHLWTDLDGTGIQDAQASGYNFNLLFSGAGAAGAYVAKPKDLTIWARGLFAGSILETETLQEMLTGSAFNDGYGLGVISFNGICSTNLVGHTGGILYTTATFYDTVNDITISLHTNDSETPIDMALIAAELFCLYSDFNTSIEEIDQLSSLKIFPNPFNEKINLTYELQKSSKVKITVFDQTGREVLNIDQATKAPGHYQEELLLDLPKGLYFLQLSIDNQLTHKKIIQN